jgi:hypothetical protein
MIDEEGGGGRKQFNNNSFLSKFQIYHLTSSFFISWYGTVFQMQDPCENPTGD